jgi:hypothetical protein
MLWWRHLPYQPSIHQTAFQGSGWPASPPHPKSMLCGVNSKRKKKVSQKLTTTAPLFRNQSEVKRNLIW